MSANTRRSVVPWQFLLFLLLFLLFSCILTYIAVRSSPSAQAAQNEPDPLDFTVVIDAGHGGEDGGAVSASGIVEKNINLAIAKKLQTMLEMNGIKVVMTRETDILLYDRAVDYRGRKKALDLAARKRIAQETENSIFVSIHLNAYPQTQYHGLQVWYSPNNESSRALAQSIQDTVRASLQPENDRQVKQATSSIYLLHHLHSPAVLVECGFLSNPEEAAKLAVEDYQNELAFLLFTAILNHCAQS